MAQNVPHRGLCVFFFAGLTFGCPTTFSCVGFPALSPLAAARLQISRPFTFLNTFRLKHPFTRHGDTSTAHASMRAIFRLTGSRYSAQRKPWGHTCCSNRASATPHTQLRFWRFYGKPQRLIGRVRGTATRKARRGMGIASGVKDGLQL